MAAFVIWNADSGLTPPRALLKVMLPVPGVKVKLRAVASLLTVPARMMAPPPEFMVMLLVKVVLEASWIFPVDVRFAWRVVVGDPVCVCVRELAEMIGLEMVKAPPLASVIAPPAVVVTVLLKVNAPDVVSAIGPATAMLALARMLAALLTVKALKGVDDPTPCRLTFPVPAVKASGKAPLTPDENVISPTPEPVFNELIPFNVTVDAKLMLSFVVVIVPPNKTAPAPL